MTSEEVKALCREVLPNLPGVEARRAWIKMGEAAGLFEVEEGGRDGCGCYLCSGHELLFDGGDFMELTEDDFLPCPDQ